MLFDHCTRTLFIKQSIASECGVIVISLKMLLTFVHCASYILCVPPTCVMKI